MSIAELINQYGIGIYIGCVITGIGIIIGFILILCLLWCLLCDGIIRFTEHYYDIDFNSLSYIHKNYYNLEKEVNELKHKAKTQFKGEIK